MLNWTLEVIFYGIATVGIGFALGITLNQIYKGNHYRYFYFSSGVWFSMLCGTFFWGLGTLLMSRTISLIGFYSLIPANLLLLLKSDSISRDTVEPIKILIFAALATLFILKSTNETDIQIIDLISGGTGFTYQGLFQLTFSLMVLMPNLVYLYLLIRMTKSAPKSLRPFSLLYLSGLCVFTFLSLILTFTLTDWIPGIQMLCFAIGAVMMAISVASHPTLIFILPFKAIRLTVLETNSGLPIFNYNWIMALKDGEEELYAGMLQGVNLIVKESLNQGEVQEIRVSDAVLLSYRSEQYPIACIIAATKSSKTLRDGLQIFAEQFTTKFSDHFTSFHNVQQFASAKDLIANCFPYIPEYK